jgi:hypothetical protein
MKLFWTPGVEDRSRLELNTRIQVTTPNGKRRIGLLTLRCNFVNTETSCWGDKIVLVLFGRRVMFCLYLSVTASRS